MGKMKKTMKCKSCGGTGKLFLRSCHNKKGMIYDCPDCKGLNTKNTKEKKK